MIITKPKIQIVATILAKNEEDIIGQMIEHTISQGVSQIIFTGNASTDRTKEIAASYPEVVEIIDEPENDHNQTKWVTHMARLACKLNPDWIVHLDADELWCGLQNLRRFDTSVVRCERMYLHPPISWEFDFLKSKHYVDFDHLPIPQECKIAHRPMEDVVITHGNHGISEPDVSYAITTEVYRHHYPIRSYNQWERKCLGHEALQRRGSSCVRWENWYNDMTNDRLGKRFTRLIRVWKQMLEDPQPELLHDLIEFWVTEEMLEFFKNNTSMMPRIGEWPKHEKQDSLN